MNDAVTINVNGNVPKLGSLFLLLGWNSTRFPLFFFAPLCPALPHIRSRAHTSTHTRTRMHTIYTRRAHTHTSHDPLPFSPVSLFYSSTTNMAAKSDGAAVSLQNETAPACLPGPQQRSPQPRHQPAQRYTVLDCCWTLCALLVFFSDGASDLWLAADYFLRGNYWCFAPTLVFIIVPSLVVQVLSFRWFAYDFADTSASDTAAAAVVAASGGGGGGADSHFSTKGSGDHQRGAGRSDATDEALPAAATKTRTTAESCCRACVWLFQSLVHILQLAQVWR